MKQLLCEEYIQDIAYIETMKVKEGVECDVYSFTNDKNKDLGIIRISPGMNTPLQKILKGNKTVEGFISGKGKLVITKVDGRKETFEGVSGLEVVVTIGETMQWIAEPGSSLVAYEICYPPYEDGRYQNLD